MKCFTFFLILWISITSGLKAQDFKVIEIRPFHEESVMLRGDLGKGVLIPDLSWAWSSSNACFPATRKDKFTGKHVVYSIVLPKYSEMEITVIPDDKQADFSLYAYEVGLQNNSIVPNLPRCIRCEVAYKWERKHYGQTQNHTRTVSDLIAIGRPYKVIFAVVGADGLDSGGYSLRIRIKSR